MTILLIAPSSGHWRGLGRKALFNGKTFRFSMLSLLSVAALTPEGHDVRIVDEQLDEIPWDAPVDLVGITVMTATAPRAWEICDRFGARGVPVVVGGFHPTFNLEEALEHADAVVQGTAGGAWAEAVTDAAAGRLKRVYRGDPDILPPMALPRHLIDASRYITVNACCATTGCRNRCAFCSITAFYDGRRYRRTIDEITAYVRSIDDRFFMFMDDNLTQDRDFALALCRALEPLGKLWGSQASVEIADDPELLVALQRAGCVGVFIGLESFSQQALCSQNKTIASPQFYRDAVRTIHRHGMVVEAGLIFGFDTDTPDVFERTLAILDDIGADAMQASILTPLPGTPLFEQMRPRIVDWDWEHYDYKWAVYEPALMTREDLMAGLEWINKRFYAPWRITKRLARWLAMPSGFTRAHIPLYLNVAYWGRQFQFGVKGYNPARRETGRRGSAGAVAAGRSRRDSLGHAH